MTTATTTATTTRKTTIIHEKEKHSLLERFPPFELSYETHKKVQQDIPSEYNIAIYIPTGKKYFIWFTFFKDKDGYFIMELNKDKKIVHMEWVEYESILSLGTILYATCLYEKETYIIEDIYYYKGIPLKNINYSEKLGFIYFFLSEHKLGFFLPKYKLVDLVDGPIEEIPIQTNYTIHHIQYRTLTRILPYINVKPNVFSTTTTTTKTEPAIQISSSTPIITPIKIDYTKPQYKYPTIFQVSADIQNDIYHLYAFGKKSKPIYYNVAYIPNYRSSIFMNTLFRKIRENANLDLIEESEDEEEFENIKEDKFVDLEKIIPMECVFHTKFKKWIPIKVVDKKEKIIHISKIASSFIK